MQYALFHPNPTCSAYILPCSDRRLYRRTFQLELWTADMHMLFMQVRRVATVSANRDTRCMSSQSKARWLKAHLALVPQWLPAPSLARDAETMIKRSTWF